MAARVNRPDGMGGGLNNLKGLGTASVTAAGSTNVIPPVGAKYGRIQLRGGSGGGGGRCQNTTYGYTYNGGTGQGGLLQRQLVKINGPFTVVIGDGGGGGASRSLPDSAYNQTPNGSDPGGNGGDSTAFGLVAKGGAGGTGTSVTGGTHGPAQPVGTDGPEPLMGFGYYSSNTQNGGAGSTNSGPGSQGNPGSFYIEYLG